MLNAEIQSRNCYGARYLSGTKAILSSKYSEHAGKTAYCFNLTDRHSLRIKSNFVISSEVGNSLSFRVDSTFIGNGPYYNLGVGKCTQCGKDKVDQYDGQKCYVSSLSFSFFLMSHSVSSVVSSSMTPCRP